MLHDRKDKYKLSIKGIFVEYKNQFNMLLIRTVGRFLKNLTKLCEVVGSEKSIKNLNYKEVLSNINHNYTDN